MASSWQNWLDYEGSDLISGLITWCHYWGVEETDCGPVRGSLSLECALEQFILCASVPWGRHLCSTTGFPSSIVFCLPIHLEATEPTNNGTEKSETMHPNKSFLLCFLEHFFQWFPKHVFITKQCKEVHYILPWIYTQEWHRQGLKPSLCPLSLSPYILLIRKMRTHGVS